MVGTTTKRILGSHLGGSTAGPMTTQHHFQSRREKHHISGHRHMFKINVAWIWGKKGILSCDSWTNSWDRIKKNKSVTETHGALLLETPKCAGD